MRGALTDEPLGRFARAERHWVDPVDRPVPNRVSPTNSTGGRRAATGRSSWHRPPADRPCAVWPDWASTSRAGNAANDRGCSGPPLEQIDQRRITERIEGLDRQVGQERGRPPPSMIILRCAACSAANAPSATPISTSSCRLRSPTPSARFSHHAGLAAEVRVGPRTFIAASPAGYLDTGRDRFQPGHDRLERPRLGRLVARHHRGPSGRARDGASHGAHRLDARRVRTGHHPVGRDHRDRGRRPEQVLADPHRGDRPVRAPDRDHAGRWCRALDQVSKACSIYARRIRSRR